MRRSLPPALLAVALALPGCGRDAAAPDPTDVAGTYALATIDGRALPVTLDGVTYAAEELTLEATGAYRWSRSLRSCASQGCESSTRVEVNGWELRGRDTVVVHPMAFRPGPDLLRRDGTRLVLVRPATATAAALPFVYLRR
jgi:hypothetical protein